MQSYSVILSRTLTISFSERSKTRIHEVVNNTVLSLNSRGKKAIILSYLLHESLLTHDMNVANVAYSFLNNGNA